MAFDLNNLESCSVAELVALVKQLLQRVASLDLVAQTASVENILPQADRTIQRFGVVHGRRHICGWTGRLWHECHAARQHGATVNRAGPNVIAPALTQHDHLGLLLSKVPEQNASTVEETLSGRALTSTRELKAILREAIKVWQEYGDGTCGLEAYRERGARIRQRLDHQLRDRRLNDTDHQRPLDGIGRQHDRGQVLLFLEHPEIEPTNNRAERGLRGAVIAKKVSHCSKNERGARTYEALKNVIAKLALRGHSVASALVDLIQGMPMPASVAR